MSARATSLSHDGIQKPAVDIMHAYAFLSILGRGEKFTFQTFKEAPATAEKPANLTRVLHGTLEQHEKALRNLNARGAGIFVMVNRGDGKGRKEKNVTSVRANYVDLDGAPLEPLIESEAPPSIIVNSSPGRWQAYWLVADEPIAEFKSTQQALITLFKSDPQVQDLPRVMRLPGFLHLKKEPFLTKMIYPELGGTS